MTVTHNLATTKFEISDNHVDNLQNTFSKTVAWASSLRVA